MVDLIYTIAVEKAWNSDMCMESEYSGKGCANGTGLETDVMWPVCVYTYVYYVYIHVHVHTY